MKRFFRRLCLVLTPLCIAVQATIGFYAASVPSAYVVAAGEDLTLPAPLTASGTAKDATVRLLGVFPVKQVAVKEAGDMDVVLGGTVFGMKLYTSGVLVVGLTDVDTASGRCRPAADAGICVGDVIEAINGQKVTTKGEVATLLERSGGRGVTVQVRRDGISFPVQFAPVLSTGEGRYKAGLWVRDSSAGIGTMSFYVPATGVFAGLGHPICDVDTGETLPISGGEIVPARVYSITKSVRGDAGELCGGFDGTGCGTLTVNGKTGVYGLCQKPVTGELVTVAPRQEVTTGPARILCTLDDSGPQWFDIQITKVRYSGSEPHMDVKVTDPELLKQTGGIVRGMSGSPIMQKGKLVGAVTHVLVNDPTRGYAIFAETMLDTANQVAAGQKAAS
ncbi:MAG: SpoIVB peptidase [Clostridia bacterium]|nr:SpoIVB peptidase [Clostridia bacterium]